MSMFKRIVSSLPFNPGLAHQLTFYAKRLHQEEAVRRLGVIFTLLALGIQVVAVASPAKTTLATSANDIVYGAKQKSHITNALGSGVDGYGRADIKQIYEYYGITLADVQAASQTVVRSRERTYITTGRGDSPGADTPVQVPGTGTTIYERSLNVWDIKNWENCYDAITGIASGNGLLKGRRFWVLLGNCGSGGGCGNITFEPIPKEPKFEMVKTAVGNGTYKVGNALSFKIEFRNPGNWPASAPVINDTLANDFEFLRQTSSIPATFSQSGQNLSWRFNDLQPSQSWHYILISVKVRNISDAQKRLCNTASAVVGNVGAVGASNPENERCVVIDNACPGSGLPIPPSGVAGCTITCPDGTILPYNQKDKCKTPVATCEYLKITGKPEWNKRKYEVKFSLGKGAKLSQASLLIEGQTVKRFGEVEGTKTFTYEHTFASQGSFTATAEATAASGSVYRQASSCTVSETLVQPFTRITLKKGVSNITQKIADANGTTAKAGDELEYSLSVSNTGNTDAGNYVIDSDQLNDILEYSDLTSYEGASYDKVHQRLTWPATTIPKAGTITKKFRVKVKSPIPTTPPSASDPLSFDFALRNVFGNEVIVKVDKPIPAIVYEGVSSASPSEIPDTGPGQTLLISLLAATVIGYFYARARLLAKEVELVKNEVGV